MKTRMILAFLMGMFPVSHIAHALTSCEQAGWCECAVYVQQMGWSDFNGAGDAKNWYGLASGKGYALGNKPMVGSVLVWKGWSVRDKNGNVVETAGHVAITASIVSNTEITVNHANWPADGKVRLGIKVADVSGGNWTRVKVSDGSTEYEVYGFIYPKSSPFDSFRVMMSPISYGKAYWYTKDLQDLSCTHARSWFVEDSLKGMSYRADVSICALTCTGGSTAMNWLNFFITPAYADLNTCATVVENKVLTEGPISESLGTPPVSGSDGSTDFPNLTMRDVYLLDANKNRVPSIRVNKNFYCHMNVKNYGEKKANGIFENRCWVSKGNKFDGKSDAEDIGKDDMDDLDDGYSRSSDEDSTGIEWPGTYNLVGCTDASEKVAESNEKDNCNVGDHAVIQEFVFQVVSDPNLVTTAINLGGKTSLSINESFVISSTTANPGENFGPDYVYIGYFIDGAFVGKNQIRRENMKGGMSKAEETFVSGGIAAVGIHEVKACADYDNHIVETNETDNCGVLLVTVSDPNTPPPNPDPEPTPTDTDDDDVIINILFD